MSKLVYYSPNPETAVSWYRSCGPMAKYGRHIKSFHWHEIGDAEIVFIERPQTLEGLKNCSRVKVLGRKLWVDIDDNLFDLPDYNRYKEFFDKAWPTIRDCIQMADVVTTATDTLREHYSKINPNTHTIRNAIDTQRLKIYDAPSDHKRILWRGSDTHSIDLLTVLPQIKMAAEIYPDWQWWFVGAFVPYVTEHIANSKNIFQWAPMTDYLATIREINPAVTIVPLQLNNFNQCKSSIAFQESTYAGAATLAANVEDYRMTPCALYETPEQFLEKLVELLENKGKRAEKFFAAKGYLENPECPHNIISQDKIREKLMVIYNDEKQ